MVMSFMLLEQGQTKNTIKFSFVVHKSKLGPVRGSSRWRVCVCMALTIHPTHPPLGGSHVCMYVTSNCCHLCDAPYTGPLIL